MYCCRYGFQSDTIVVSRRRLPYSILLVNSSMTDTVALSCLSWAVCHSKYIKTEETLFYDRQDHATVSVMMELTKIEYGDRRRETTIVSDWKPYLQQYTKIIKMPTLQTYFSYILLKLKRTRNQMTSDLYVLNWKSSYDVILLMYQRRQQYFAEF